MIDIHSHILPNVDDGSTSQEKSIEMLKEAQRQGITDVILTPHFRLGMFETTKEQDKKAFEEFSQTAKEQGIAVNLYLGQEVHYCKTMEELISNGTALTLNGTKYLLLEFSFTTECDTFEVVYNLTHRGYKVILAHYERFSYATLEKARELKSLGAEFQVNAYTILGKEGGKSKKLVRKMLEEGLCSYVASDVHSDKTLDMLDAYTYVAKAYGKDYADEIFTTNARKIINNG